MISYKECVETRLSRKAKLLLHLLSRSSIISWDDSGRVTINNQLLHGSNIIDLLNDVLRNRKHSSPVGWEPFAHVLASLNVPREFINNDQRWTYIQRLNGEHHDTSDDEDEYPEPSITDDESYPSVTDDLSPPSITDDESSDYMTADSDDEELTHVAGFSTVEKLWLATNKVYDKTEIADWLRSQESHTSHRARRTRF
ncbi:hypothetical protein B566_EDAN015143 [Ephemera danica]|nr:hypothetical protein B566_EDAN015143 [Ephemera danica]